MPRHTQSPTREEIRCTAAVFFFLSNELREEIERLPTKFRDFATYMAIAPFLTEGQGITPRSVVMHEEKVLREMVKLYFRRRGYECYTDKELWIRARSYERGGFGKEEYPTCLQESQLSLLSRK
jgi:hypothetical protein